MAKRRKTAESPENLPQEGLNMTHDLKLSVPLVCPDEISNPEQSTRGIGVRAIPSELYHADITGPVEIISISHEDVPKFSGVSTPQTCPSSPKGSAARTSEALELFLASKPPGETRDRFYKVYLPKCFPPLSLTSTPSEIDQFITNLRKSMTPGGRHAYYRAIRAFLNWSYSPRSGLDLRPGGNPMPYVTAPKVPRKLMPAQNKKSIETLLSHVKGRLRDGAIICVLIDSGGRLNEVGSIREPDILWEEHCIRAVAKGGDEVLMPLGPESDIALHAWLSEYSPNGGPIWGIGKDGIVSMLRRLEKTSGIKCNAHTFRRGFASILRRNRVDLLDIMKLGHWKSLAMVQRYTESVDFVDSLQRYHPPLEHADVTCGLPNELVPRSGVEPLTRGFSVRCSTT
jgi:integrase